MDKSNFMEKAINWSKKKSIEQIRANHDGFEQTNPFKNKDTEEEIYPDISFVTSSGAKHYTEVALKQDAYEKLVTRWKLLGTIASYKRGKLHLLAPKGHKMFTQRLVDQYKINAMVYSL
jgi:hypothetical protein